MNDKDNEDNALAMKHLLSLLHVVDGIAVVQFGGKAEGCLPNFSIAQTISLVNMLTAGHNNTFTSTEMGIGLPFVQLGYYQSD